MWQRERFPRNNPRGSNRRRVPREGVPSRPQRMRNRLHQPPSRRRPSTVLGPKTWTEAVDNINIPNKRPGTIGQYYQQRTQDASSQMDELKKKLRTVGAIPIELAPNQIRLNMTYDDGEDGFVDVAYFDTGDDDITGVVRLDNGETVSTNTNPTTEEMLNILNASNEYQTPYTTAGREVYEAASIADCLEEALVDAAQTKGKYYGHRVNGNVIIWNNQGTDVEITVVGPDERGQIRINIDGPGIRDTVATNLQQSNMISIAEAVLLKLYSINTTGKHVPAIYPGIKRRTTGSPAMSAIYTTDIPIVRFEPKTLEIALSYARKKKSDQELTNFCEKTIEHLGKSGNAVVKADAKGKNLKSIAFDGDTSNVITLEDTLFRWLCEWAKDYADSAAMLKQLVTELNKVAKASSEPVRISDFPHVARNLKPTKKQTKKKNSTKKTKTSKKTPRKKTTAKKKAGKKKKTSGKKKAAKKAKGNKGKKGKGSK